MTHIHSIDLANVLGGAARTTKPAPQPNLGMVNDGKQFIGLSCVPGTKPGKWDCTDNGGRVPLATAQSMMQSAGVPVAPTAPQ